LAGGSVHLIDVSAILKHNGIAGSTRKLDIIFGEVGHLCRLPGLRVIDEDIHRTVAVGKEEDIISNPHREDVLSDVVRNVLYRLRGGIVYPDVIRHTALIVFPGTEFAHGTVVGQLLSVGRITTETAFGQGNGFGQATFAVDGIEFTGKTTADTVAIYDLLAVGAPCHYDIIRSHAVAQIITCIGRGVSKALRFTACGGYGVHFRIAIILTGKGNRLAIR